MFAVVSSIFRSSAHVEIWYGLADDPVPPANAAAANTGVAPGKNVIVAADITMSATTMTLHRFKRLSKNFFIGGNFTPIW
jgi:ethanolamine utilization microcompartment shell protein EutS